MFILQIGTDATIVIVSLESSEQFSSASHHSLSLHTLADTKKTSIR